MKPTKPRKVKSWPKNLHAEEIRREMDQAACIIDEEQDRYEELERELRRRGLKP